MRMAFGLVGLLVTIGVIAWFMHAIYLPDVNASLHAQQKAETFVNQLNGVDANGMRIEDTYAEIPDTRADGKLQDIQITMVRPGSPMETKFGLKANDVVIAAIDGHTVRTDLSGLESEQAGKDAIRDAYTTDGQLVVQRGDVQLTLPVPKSLQPPPAPAPTNTTAQNQQMQQNAQRTEQQQEHGKSGNGDENGTMDEIRQRMHALPTY